MDKVLMFSGENLEFQLDSSMGTYFHRCANQFELVVGEKYTVTWDGTTYECTAFVAESFGAGTVCIGNEGVFTGTTTEIVEPFVVAYVPANNVNSLISMTDTEPVTHTVSVYKVEKSASVNIVLRDRNGNPVEYPGVEKIKVNTVDGETAEYLHTSIIPESVEKTVELDFSGGDMAITPADGQVFSKVNIPVPETLIPENIAEGVDIAGIIGALAGGGVVFAGGQFTGSVNQFYTLEHNMGVVPDLIMIHSLNRTSTGGNYYIREVAFALSDKAKELSGYYRHGWYQASNGGSTSNYTQTKSVTNTNNNGWAHHATETTITLGAIVNDITYGIYGQTFWIAIGGLT